MRPLFLHFAFCLLPFSVGFADPAPYPYQTTPPAKKPYPYANKQETTNPTKKEPPPKLEEADTFHTDSSSFRFSAKHREANGIGYDQGYTSLDGFFTFSSIGNWHPFFDVRAHVFNNGRPAANGGFGVRYLPETVPVVFGINGFFDFKNTKNSTFEQVGFGLEVLGARWFMRANGYIPIFGKNNTYSTGFYRFQDHQAIFRSKSDVAFKGFDVSVGRTLVKRKLWDLTSTLGGYMFFADYAKEASGGLIKFKSNLSLFSLETQASYDTYFKGIVQIQAAFNIPFGKQIKNKTKGLSKSTVNFLANRISEEVDRFEMIVSTHHNTDCVGKDPRTGKPLQIIFVNNTRSDGGNGSASSPYNNLIEAQHHSHPGNMIYVYGGDGTPKHMNHGITLKKGQWLQGGANEFLLDTDFGPCGVPAKSHLRPSISHGTGNTITLANNNIVNGFDIRSSDSAIFGENIKNLTLENNDFIVSFDKGIELINPSGTISIENNISRSLHGLFLHTNHKIHLTIKDNIFSNTVSNFDLDIAGNGDDKVLIRGNTFKNSHLASLLVTRGTNKIDVNIERNTFTDISAPYCLRVVSTASSDADISIKDNIFNAPSRSLSLKTDLLAKANWSVIRNVGHHTGAVTTTLYPFDFETTSLSRATLLLRGNFATNNGYLLENTSLLSTFNAISPTGSIIGLEAINTGSFTTSGVIHFIEP